jgi:hypothetical protein
MTDQEIGNEFDSFISGRKFTILSAALSQFAEANSDSDFYKLLKFIVRECEKRNYKNKENYDELKSKYGFDITVQQMEDVSKCMHLTRVDVKGVISCCFANKVSLDFFRRYYINFIKTIPNHSIECKVDLTLTGNFNNLPFFLRKFSRMNQLVIDKTNFTSLNYSELPKMMSVLNMDNNYSLKDVYLAGCVYFTVSNCTSLTNFTLDVLEDSPSVILQMDIKTGLTSGENFHINAKPRGNKKDTEFQIIGGIGIKSFKGFKQPNIKFLFKSKDPMVKIENFMGLDARSEGVDYDPDNVHMFERSGPVEFNQKHMESFFPKVKDAYNTYWNYVKLCKEHPEIFDNMDLIELYNINNLEEYKRFITKYNSYNVDKNNLILLIKLLSK